MLRPAPLLPSINHSDPFLPINRATAALQKTIQSLLDAQSEALVSGSGADDLDTPVTSNGSTPTPSVYSASRDHTRGIVPVRQPPKHRVSLRSARRGLIKSMQEFAAVKEEESNIVGAEAEKRNTALNALTSFMSKKSGLEQQIADIQSEDVNQRATDLKSEAQTVEREIHELETKLYELRIQHRYLVTEAKQLENTVSSKLSSYQASLHIVENDIERFLTRPPIAMPLASSSTAGLGTRVFDDEHSAFYSLNPKRRTIAMAQEIWTDENLLLSQKRASAIEDHQALLEGSRVWSKVVEEVRELEKRIRHQMQKEQPNMYQANEGLGSDENDLSAPHDQDKRSAEMEDMIHQMDRTILSLSSKLRKAEDNGWNILICCIGAELEALRQGRNLLSDALGIVVAEPAKSPAIRHDDDPFDPAMDDPPQVPLYDEGAEDDGMGRPNQEPRPEHVNGVPFTGDQKQNQPQTEIHSVESEDDEPGPDLLISHE